MAKQINPYDRFFKAVFSRKETAKKLITEFFPALANKMDFSSLTREPDTYVDKDLREHLGDMVFKLKSFENEHLKVAFILEQKSYSDMFIKIQLLRYVANMWQSEIRSKNPLSVPITIVIYSGDKHWKIPDIKTTIGLKTKFFDDYLPEFKVLQLNIKDVPDTKIRKLITDEFLYSYMFISKAILLDFQEFMRRLKLYLENMANLVGQENVKYEALKLTVNFLNSLKKFDKPQKQEIMKTLVQQQETAEFVLEWFKENSEMLTKMLMEKEFKEGVEEGKRIGVEEGKKEAILLMHKKGFKPEVISEILEVDIQKVKKIIEENG